VGALPTLEEIEHEVPLESVASAHDPPAAYGRRVPFVPVRRPPAFSIVIPPEETVVTSPSAPLRPLSRLLGAASLARFNTVALFEEGLLTAAAAHQAMDFGSLVFAGCQIVEQELRDLLAPCAREASTTLLDALVDDDSPRMVLEGWFSGKVPASMGVRTRYRNPLAHGERIVGADDYADFSLLAVGANSFRQWDRSGPLELADMSHKAVLHHHLWLRHPEGWPQKSSSGGSPGNPPP
jgi:hypothetical protein